MKLAVAQCEPAPGDVGQNLDQHLRLVRLAVAQGCALIVFPELSLTSYEPSLAAGLAMRPDDPRLAALQQLSDGGNIAIAVGMPLASQQGVQIGKAIFQPGQVVQTYAKQHLHADELPFFVPGQKPFSFELEGLRVTPAICYESLLPHFMREAAERGTHIYLASVAKTAAGMEKAHAVFSEAAQKHQMAILLSNTTGPNDDFIGGGKSAIWDRSGKLTGQLDPFQTGILSLETGKQPASSSNELVELPSAIDLDA